METSITQQFSVVTIISCFGIESHPPITTLVEGNGQYGATYEPHCSPIGLASIPIVLLEASITIFLLKDLQKIGSGLEVY